MKKFFWFTLLIVIVTLSFGTSLLFAAEPDFSKVPTAPKPEKLTVVLFEPVEQKAAFEVSKLFEEKFGIKVEINAIPWSNLHEKIIADLTAKTGTYDIIFIPGLWSLEFIYADYIEPLNQFWDNPNLPKFDIEDYPASVVNLVSQDGNIYWIPHHGTTQILFYRKDLFEAEGLKPPETYDELFEIAAKFTNNPKYPDVWGFATTPAQGEFASSTWSTWLWSWGGDYFDENWNPIFNNEIGVASLEAYAEAVKKFSPPDSLNWGNDDSGAAFQQGRLAMLQMWPYLGAAMEDPSQSKVVGKVGYAPLPKKELLFPRLGSWGGTISKFSKNKEWAYMWLAFYNSKENTNNILVPSGVAVDRLSTVEELKDKILWQEAVNLSFEHTKERPGIPEITPIIDVWGLAVSKVVTGQADAKSALDEAAVKVRKILEDAGYYD
jgi:multiple sugar transport system substrate-binding protein